MKNNIFITCALLLLVFLCSEVSAQQKKRKSTEASAQKPMEIPKAEEHTATSENVTTEENSASTSAEEERIYTVVEKHAEFPGGSAALQKFMDENLKLPKEAKKANVEGKVYTKFLVEKDGHITEIQIIKGLHAGCDEEAIRMIKAMPSWKPASQRGQVVRSYAMLAVPFEPKK